MQFKSLGLLRSVTAVPASYLAASFLTTPATYVPCGSGEAG